MANITESTPTAIPVQINKNAVLWYIYDTAQGDGSDAGHINFKVPFTVSTKNYPYQRNYHILTHLWFDTNDIDIIGELYLNPYISINNGFHLKQLPRMPINIEIYNNKSRLGTRLDEVELHKPLHLGTIIEFSDPYYGIEIYWPLQHDTDNYFYSIRLIEYII